MLLREGARGGDGWRCRGQRLTVSPGRTAVRRAGQGEGAPGQQIPPRGHPVAAAAPRSPGYLRAATAAPVPDSREHGREIATLSGYV